jgi:hypothetical protein
MRKRILYKNNHFLIFQFIKFGHSRRKIPDPHKKLHFLKIIISQILSIRYENVIHLVENYFLYRMI